MRNKLGVLLMLMTVSAAVSTRAELPSRPRDDAAPPDQLAEVQGVWVRTMKSDSGTFKVVKEHKGNKTTVTIFDSEGIVVTAKTSEFRVENTGKVRILTFFNNTITAGPQKGRTNNEPQSYIYRITGDTFVEVKGLLVSDHAEPLVFAWKRLRE